MKAIGIDLAGKEKNPTGIATLKDRYIKTRILNSDEEIIENCKSEDPEIIAIDAPLNLPEDGGLRKAESDLISRGHRVLPPLLGGMRALTERGIKLSEKLRELGFQVIEIHPRTSGIILFESDSRKKWTKKLREEKWNLDSKADEHEIDSALAALTGFLHLDGKTKKIGEAGKEIIIPQKELTAL